MRVVFDSNVIIAAFATRGACSEVFQHALASHDVVTGEFILGEVREKLASKIGLPAQRVSEIAAFLRAHCAHVDAAPLPAPMCRDPDDDHVLAIARAAGADVLLTGDRDLLDLESYAGIRIVAPADFFSFERSRERERP